MGLRNEAERLLEEALRDGQDELQRHDGELTSSNARAVADKVCRGLNARSFQDRVLRHVSDFLEGEHERLMRDVERSMADKMEDQQQEAVLSALSDVMRAVPDEAERRVDELERILERWLRDWGDTMRELHDRL